MRYTFTLGIALLIACGGSDTVAPEPPATPVVPVGMVVVTASRSSLVTGESVELTAEARDAQGQVMPGKTAQWSSSNPVVASVSATGTVKGIAEGDATITATIEGKTGSVTLIIRNVFRESALTVSTLVGLGGDTLTLSGSAGIKYSLEIPAGALEKPVTISMTPVTGLAGAAAFSGGLLGSVQFAPSGLRFLRPVRLKVTGFTAPTGGRVPVSFVAKDDGSVENMVPSSLKDGTLTLVVPHFSILGAGAEVPAALSKIPLCPAPCTGAGFHQNSLSLLLANNGSPADINQVLAFWGRSIETGALISGVNSTAGLMTAIAEYGLWVTTIEFVRTLRPDLDAIFVDDPLSSQMDRNIVLMGEALLAGIDRNARACRDSRSLAEAEVVLFWQEQAEALQLRTLDLPPVEGRGDFERDVILRFLQQQCFSVELDTALLAEPLPIGKPRDLTTRFKVKFLADPDPRGAPFGMELVPRDVVLAHEEGFTDANGEFQTSATAEAIARTIGTVGIMTTGCLILPTQAALGAQAKPSDICDTQLVERSVELYFNDFSGSVGNEWSFDGTSVAPTGQRFLGELGNQSVLLAVDSLPGHDSLVVQVDLYMIDSWNGNGGVGASASPDLVTIGLQDGLMLKQTTFSNKPRDSQAFPLDYPGGAFPAGTGALITNSLGYPPGSDHFGDAIYRLTFRFPHTDPVLSLVFTSGQTSGPGGERWGIDNVRVSIPR